MIKQRQKALVEGAKSLDKAGRNVRSPRNEPRDVDADPAALVGLSDRLRAHKNDSSDYIHSSESSIASESLGSEQDGSFLTTKDESSRPKDEETSADAGNDASTEISFGALAKAQFNLDKEELPMKAHSGFEGSVREYPEAQERKAGKKDHRDFGRASKHAPSELSSKKAVSRKRSVVPLQKIDIRDPRFEPAVGKVDPDKVKKNYLFLAEYRDSEIAELKAGIRKSKDVHAKETMKRALISMESRKQAEKLKEQRQEVVRRHRKEEEAKVESGKRPFYLKKADVKKQALEERLQGMKGKDRAKAIERRRKKLTSRERKDMPDARRG